MKPKVLLAYSGGLDTSVILHWLIDKGYAVDCYIADVGQDDDFAAAQEKAFQIGAKDVIVDDLKAAFVEEFVVPFVKTGAVYEGRYLLGTALARPLIARGMVEVALQQGAAMLAHGATGKGNDQVRFELAIRQLLPSATILAPWRDETFLKQFQGRRELLTYAHEKGIPVESNADKPFSMDANIAHVSYEGGVLEDPQLPPPPEMFQMTQSIEKAPDIPCDLTLHFANGVPMQLCFVEGSVASGATAILETLNEVGGRHGVGRVDIVESRIVGLKSRGVYEAPGVTILLAAHRDLECLTLDREVIKLKESLKPKLAELIYDGLWFSPEWAILMAAVEESQRQVSGEVHLRIFKGNVTVLGRNAPQCLYDRARVSMDEHGGYQAQDATGFIKIQALRLQGSSSRALTNSPTFL